ncbi:MAG: FHA domain-containing protein [Oscillospiraceae bacterium]|nr:FHA domain-containing protein [Oscillospiraceae bacterium]
MNIVRCKNGHFYDRDIYSVCPHCGESKLAGEADDESGKGKSKKKKFGKQKKKDTPVVRVEESPKHKTEQTPDIAPFSNNQDDEKTEAMDFGFENQSRQQYDKSATLDYWGMSASQSEEVAAEKATDGFTDEIGVNEADKIVHEKSVNDIVNREETPKVEKADSEQSLSNAIKRASANSAGTTMSYFSTVMSAASEESTPQVSTDPVVGWLVCVGGKHFGQSFNITTGKNSIGRDESNRIVLPLDNRVSRSKHALITYEPKKRNFYLQPGESSGLTYLNDDYIDESKILRAKDIIELGESKFIFIPLCDESFTWEDYIKR